MLEKEEKLEEVNAPPVASPSPSKAVTLSKRMQKMKRMLPVLSLILFVAGVYSISIFVTDTFSSNSYVSENALQPGVADPQYSSKHHRRAVDLTKEYLDHIQAYTVDHGMSLSQWIAHWLEQQLHRIQLDSVYLHRFPIQTPNGMWHEGINTVGILKSPRTSGRESLVINTASMRDDFKESTRMRNPVSSVCMAIVLMEHLQSVHWLSKDVILVITDSTAGDESIRAWLDTYHNYMQQKPTKYFAYDSPAALYFPNTTQTPYHIYSQVEFERAGPIRGALVLDFFADKFYYIIVSPEGINGKLPNLDLLNSIDRVAMYSENSHTILMNQKDPIVNYLFTGEDAMFPNLPFTAIQLTSFIIHCALGEPTGNHGWFLQYNIDAVTLRLQTEVLRGAESNAMSMINFARVVEGTMRTLSNLIEHFHQSFYYYLLSTTFRYIPIGHYMITFGMILGSVTIFLASICIGEDIESFAARAVPRQFVFQAAGLLLYALFILFFQLPGSFIALLIILSSLALKIVKRVDEAVSTHLYGERNRTFTAEEKQVKAKVVTLVSWLPVIMFLATFSLLNFPFCLIASILVGMISLVFRPTHKSASKDKLCAVGLLVVSPISMYFLANHFVPFDLLYYMVFLHFRYSSLIYPFLTLIYYPFILSLFSLAQWDL